MVHLSRLAEELTWWSNPRFGFVHVSDAFSTGSSMMPNKKNPDPVELVRGRTGRRDRRADRRAGPAQGPAPGLPARPPGGQGRRCSKAVATFGASLDVLAGLLDDLTIDREQDAGRRRRGLHHRDRGGRCARPPGPAVPGRPPCRRSPRRPGRGGRDRPRSAVRRGHRGRLARGRRPAGGGARGRAGPARRRSARPHRSRPPSRRCDVVGGTAPDRVAAAIAAARQRLGR